MLEEQGVGAALCTAGRDRRTPEGEWVTSEESRTLEEQEQGLHSALQGGTTGCRRVGGRRWRSRGKGCTLHCWAGLRDAGGRVGDVGGGQNAGGAGDRGCTLHCRVGPQRTSEGGTPEEQGV